MRDPKTGRFVKAEKRVGFNMSAFKETDVILMKWGEKVQLTPEGYAAHIKNLHERDIDPSAYAANLHALHQREAAFGEDHTGGYYWEGNAKHEIAPDLAARLPDHLTPQHFGALGNDGFRDRAGLGRTGPDAQMWNEAYPVASERVQSAMIADRVEKFADAAGWPEPKPERGLLIAFLLILFLIVGVSIGVLIMHPTW